MPRIDPQQLLSCLTPLLAVNGGIKSSGEVIRLANLMQKYSKKLVSKCIYIQILKCTETDLLGQFMAANGWNLVHTWLNDSVNSANWPFVQEILEMLLLCPVDSNRLKSNHTPKIVKNLSMNISQNQMITALSKKLVEQWLKIAHQEKQLIEQQQQNGLNGSSNSDNLNVNNSDSNEIDIKMALENNNINGTAAENNIDEEDSLSKKSSESIKYKISNNKDSGLVLSIKRSTSPSHNEHEHIKSPESKLKSEHKSKSSSSSDKDRDKKKSSSSSSSSSHKSSSSSKSSHRDKDRSSSRSSSSSRHHSSSSKSSSSKSSSRDKDKEREKKKRDIEKEQAEKDKETLSFLTPLPSNKLQRIPKRQHSESESDVSSKKSSEPIEKKKPSISIENRKGDKPKTVKTINSQFRNHGLAEEPPPPPSRKTLKKPATNNVILSSPTSSTASPSSLSSSKPISPPPSKKIHLDKALELDIPERAGGVKLIKPKPMLVESSGFLDALDASAFMNKKDSKKRKRLPSGSSSSGGKKEEPESPKIEAKPLKFYKDTLEENAEEEKEKEKSSNDTEGGIESPTKELDISIDIKNDNKGDNNDEESKSDDSVTVKKSDAPSSPVAEVEGDNDEPEEKRPPGIGTGEDGPPGIIKIPNRYKKRVKRSIRWRSDEELVDIHYFPLEENERVNVTKTFMEQKHMEHIHERNALLGRRQDEQTNWRTLIIIENVPEIQYGSKSLEAKIQMEREKITLQEVFFDGRSMSDSPAEPDFEHIDMGEPATIPLEDVTGNTDSITSFRDLAWPTPKGEQPQFISHGGFGNIFNAVAPNITIPPAPVINPLAGLNLGVAGLPHDNTALNFMGIIQTAATAAAISPFMQPPPMIQNNYQSNSSSGSSSNFNNRGNANNYSTGSNSSSSQNNRSRSGSGSGGGSNWVRGNASQNMRRGMCHQYQRTGFCRNRSSGCPYIHER